MKKLEDIPKKDFFEAPEGYFDRLPGIIQSRVTDVKREPEWISYFRVSLKYALPVLVIGIASVFYFNQPGAQSTENLLASIDSEQLVAYLDDSDVSSDDLLESIQLDSNEATAIHEDSMEITIDATELENISDELKVDYF